MLAPSYMSQCKNNSIQTKLTVWRGLRKKEYCRTSYDTCNEKKEEMWRKKSERERARKTLGDLSSLRTKCEGIPPSRDCRVSTAFHSRYYCLPGTRQEETKNNP